MRDIYTCIYIILCTSFHNLLDVRPVQSKSGRFGMAPVQRYFSIDFVSSKFSVRGMKHVWMYNVRLRSASG